jgi:hypothetical protein
MSVRLQQLAKVAVVTALAPLLFLFVVVPAGMFTRFMRRDKWSPDTGQKRESFWLSSVSPETSMRRQY